MSTHHAWKVRSTVVNKNTFGALYTDLPKAFDYICHELFLPKFHAYLFSMSAWRHSLNSAYSSCKEILFGVLQGSILGPFLFNIFLCDLLYMVSDTDSASYADCNTPYVSVDTIDEVT